MNTPNQVEVRSTLARLLATENLRVRHGNYRTAFFDVKSRLLGLPIWKDCSKAVYDLLTGHEVGHALFTPQQDFDRAKIRFDYMNVVEDIRIEKLIQTKYPGLIRCFLEGYNELLNKNFFETKGKDLSKLSFPDRINLKAKCGDLVNIEFTGEELRIWNLCQDAKTFNDALKAAEELTRYMKNLEQKQEQRKQEKEKQKQKQKQQNQDEDPTSGCESDDSSDDGDEEKDEKSSKKSKKSKKDEKKDDSKKSKKDDDESDDDESDDDDSDGGDSDSDDDGDSDSDEDGDSDSDSDEDGDSDSDEDGDSDSDSDEDGDSAEDAEGDSDDGKDEKKTKSNKSGPSKEKGEGSREEPADQTTESITMKAFEEALKSLVDLTHSEAQTGRLVPPTDAEAMNTVMNYKAVMAARPVGAKTAPQGFKSFLSQTKKFISVLAQEFEIRKSANQYLRATQAKTGTINVNRLHSYKFEEEIFKSVTVLANSKNHGLMMFVDYSGSMDSVIGDVYIQAINIALFCKAVSIPFDIYGFTTGHRSTNLDKGGTFEGKVDFGNTQIAQIVSSSMTKMEFDQAIVELYNLYRNKSYRIGFDALGGTPLNETLLVAHNLVNSFKLRHKVEKMSVVVVSDGDGTALRIRDDYAFKADRSQQPNYTHMEASLFGRRFRTSLDARTCTMALIDNLRLSLGVKVIGFFITTEHGIRGEVVRAIQNGHNKKLDVEKLMKNYAVEKMVHVPGGQHYDDYFVITNNLQVLNDDFSTFTGNVSAATDLQKSFNDYGLRKRFSRVFATKFAEAIR